MLARSAASYNSAHARYVYCKCHQSSPRRISGVLQRHAATKCSTSQQLSQTEAFQALASQTPTCIANINEPLPGYKALVAAVDLQKGQTVLQIPPCNSLCVPTSGPAYRWECDWLEPFERVHGQLPAALSYYLADLNVHQLLRLAILVLYVNKLVTSPSANPDNSSSRYWRSWLQLLPPLTAASYPGAGWTDSDIQQLQYEPAKSLVASEANVYEGFFRQFKADFGDPTTGLHHLGLAADMDDIRWAVFIAKTRCVADSTSLRLHPIHDFINHSDTPNCQALDSSQGYLVKAVADISAGTELTISYAPPEGLCNLELLISWGFTTCTRLHDWALPQIIHLLPPVSYNIAVTAAVRVEIENRVQGDSTVLGPEDLDKSWDRLDRLQVAAASLPMAIVGSSATGAAAAAATAQMYAHAANCLQEFGISHKHQQQRQWQQLTRNMLQTGMTDPLRPYRAPDQKQSLDNQHQFLLAFDDGAFEALEVMHSKSVQRIQQWQQHVQGYCMQGVDTADLQLQRLSAAAVKMECQLLLLQSGTTIQQDEQLLVLLQQQQQQRDKESIQQQQQQCSDPKSGASDPASVAAAAAVSVGAAALSRVRARGPLFRPKSPASTNSSAAAPHAAAAAGSSTAAPLKPRSRGRLFSTSSSAVAWGLEDAAAAAAGSSTTPMVRPTGRGRLFGTTSSSSAAASSANQNQETSISRSSKPTAATMTTTTSSNSSSMGDPAAEHKFQTLLQQFREQQELLLRHLIVLQAYTVLSGSSSSSSFGADSRSAILNDVITLSQMQLTARLVVRTLGYEEMGEKPLGAQQQQQQQQHELLAKAEALISQQQQILQQLQQQQQDGQQELQCEESLRSDGSVARLMAAVAARLEHKRLLMMCSELADSVQDRVVWLDMTE